MSIFKIGSRPVSEAEFNQAAECVEWNTPVHENHEQTHTTTLNHEGQDNAEFSRITITSTRSEDGRSFTDILTLHR